MKAVAESGSTSIDPDEPWRYACPNCGSVSVRKLLSARRPKGKTYSFDGNGQEDIRQDRMKLYRCEKCCDRYMKVVDKKNGGLCEP